METSSVTVTPSPGVAPSSLSKSLNGSCTFGERSYCFRNLRRLDGAFPRRFALYGLVGMGRGGTLVVVGIPLLPICSSGPNRLPGSGFTLLGGGVALLVGEESLPVCFLMETFTHSPCDIIN